MSEEVRTNKRRRSESEEPEEEAGDGAGADVVGTGAPSTEVPDNSRAPESAPGEEPEDAADHQVVADTTPAAPIEPPKIPNMQTMQLPIQVHHQVRIEDKPQLDNYYKTEQPTVEASEYKISSANTMAALGNMGGVGVGVPGVNPNAMGANLGAMGGMGGLALGVVPGMNIGIGGVDVNQQLLAHRQYDFLKAHAQSYNNAAAVAAAAAARAAPKPAAPTGRKSAPSSYEPPVQLTASGRPARARRVNYAELAGALDDEEEDDQANLVPNWARRRRKTSDQDRDYGVGVGGGSRGGNVQMGGASNNAAMYGVPGAGNFNSAPRAQAPAAGVNLYGLTGQGAAGLRNAVGGAQGAGLQAANLAVAGMAGNAALGGQAGWQGQVVWGQTPGMGGFGALQTLAAAQARPAMGVGQQFVLPPGAARGVAPNIMQDMQLMLSRGADGQGGMPGAGQQR